MATFYGGEQLVEFKEISGVSSAGGEVIYTVPSGRYSEIFIILATNVLAFTKATFDIEVSGTPPDNSVNAVGSGVKVVLLTESDNLKAVVGGTNYVLYIKEYLKP